jgi:hypothetical protein
VSPFTLLGGFAPDSAICFTVWRKSASSQEAVPGMEETVIRMAAPTLAGIKTGSLFPYYYESREELGKEMGRLNRLLIPRGLRLVLLRLTERSALLYLFRPSKLEIDLKDHTAGELLRCAGYPCSNCGPCLCHLLKRFQHGEEFPHEIGLFLSYPPEDVKGFLADRDNYKSICMWKVYDDEEKAKRVCASYEKCTECYCRMWQKGRRLEQLAVAS